MIPVAIFCAFLGAELPSPAGTAPTPVASPTAVAPPASFPGSLPATFAGTLPCADCPGTRHLLNLFSDGVFYHRIAYIDRKTSFDQVGRWQLSDDGRILTLTEPASFAVVDGATLRQLDREGRPMESTLNFDLRRQSGFSTLEPRLRMDGMYRQTKDGGRFTECSTGRDMPVVPQKKGYRELEAAYAKAAARDPGQPLLVSIDARLMTQSGTGSKTAVLIRQFIRAHPEKTCPPARSAP